MVRSPCDKGYGPLFTHLVKEPKAILDDLK